MFDDERSVPGAYLLTLALHPRCATNCTELARSSQSEALLPHCTLDFRLLEDHPAFGPLRDLEPILFLLALHDIDVLVRELVVSPLVEHDHVLRDGVLDPVFTTRRRSKHDDGGREGEGEGEGKG